MALNQIDMASRYFKWEINPNGRSLPVVKFTEPTCKVGVLLITVINALELYKGQAFGEISPFVVLRMGKIKRKVPKDKKGGVSPRWNHNIQFSVSGADTMLHVAVMAKGKLHKHVNIIGKCSIPLEYLLQMANPYAILTDALEDEYEQGLSTSDNSRGQTHSHQTWFQLGRDKDLKIYAGKIQLKVTFFPDIDAALQLEKVRMLQKHAFQRLSSDPQQLNESRQLTSIHQTGTLHYKKSNKKKKIKIFGGYIATAVALSKYDIPRVVHDCVEYLLNNHEVKGLFQVPGDPDAIQKIKHDVDHHIDIGYNDPHVAASVLILYLQELVIPIIPYSHYNHFVTIGMDVHTRNTKDITRPYRILMASIPFEHRTLLGYLCKFLVALTLNVEANDLTIKILANIFSVVFIRKKKSSTTRTEPLPQPQEIASVETLLIYHEQIFFQEQEDQSALPTRSPLQGQSMSSVENMDDNTIETKARHIIHDSDDIETLDTELQISTENDDREEILTGQLTNSIIERDNALCEFQNLLEQERKQKNQIDVLLSQLKYAQSRLDSADKEKSKSEKKKKHTKEGKFKETET